MNNLSQTQETFDSEPKNNENQMTELISSIHNEFRVIGRVLNELKKDYVKKKIVCRIVLAVQSGTILELFAFNKLAEEIATVYSKGDIVTFVGQFYSKITKESKLVIYLIPKTHMLIKKSTNDKTLSDYENELATIEKLYDPYKVRERMKGKSK